MRDNHEGLPEILDAYERGGHYFAVVRVRIDRLKAFEFGIERRGYTTLRRILQERPFERTAATACRYFFVPSVQRVPDGDSVGFDVRIEQGRRGKQFSFSGPLSLVANLMWFYELATVQSADHLKAASFLSVVSD